MRFSVRVFFLLFMFISLFGFGHRISARAQDTATLSGAVTDPRGAAIAGAQISVEQIPSTDQSARTLSGSEGRFSVTLAPGRYRVTISRDSFAQIVEEITIAAGETRELQVRMTLEPLSSKVVVTAQTVPLDADSSPAPVTILTRQEIDQRVATSLPDLLATQPGFSLGRTGPEGGTASLFLDGGNSNYTKALIDGTPANSPGGLIDFSNVTLDNIEKIEIVHGAESALYGSDAMDGVIQIFTRRGTTRVPEFTAFADGGNFSTGRGGAELSGLLGRFDYSAGVSDLETQGQGPNDAFRNRTLSGNFGWKLTDTARISLALRDNVSDTGTPGQTLLEPPNLTDSTALHDFNASLHADFASGTHWRHQVIASESYNRELNVDPSFPTFYQFNRSSFEGQSTYSIKGFGVTAGYDYEVENGLLSSPADGGLIDIVIHARRNNQAGFLDAQWQPLARLVLSAGARAEDNSYFGTHVLPRAGISYVLRTAQGVFGDTRLYASYGQGIVEPRFDQSYGNDPCFPGDPNLLPEQSRTVHAGIEQKFASDRLRVTADYFDNLFHNIISFQSVTASAGCLAIGDPFGAGTYFNTNLARARGANLSGEARLTHWFTASAHYTYDSTRTLSAPNDFDPNYIVGSRLLRRPVNSGNVVLNAAFRRMNWNLSGYFTGRRADSDFLGLGLTNNPGYARFDFAGSYNLGRGVSFYGRIANLADNHYQDAIGYPALGREFRIGVKYTTRHE